MADARTFYVEDSTGAPLNGGAAGMTASAYNADGSGDRPHAPTLAEIGDGVYQVEVSDDDETAGTVVVVDTGAGNDPRFVVFECFKPDRSNQFWAVPVVDLAGAPWTGAAPTVGSYKDKTASPRTPPAVVDVKAGWIFSVKPTPADVAADTSIRLLGPTGSAQPSWSESTEPLAAGSSAPPTVAVVSPLAGSDLSPNATITLDVTDDVGLRRALIVARFASLALEEVVHQGDRFAARYAGTVTPIAGGSRIAFTRLEGWPAPPTIDVYALDTSGGEA